MKLIKTISFYLFIFSCNLAYCSSYSKDTTRFYENIINFEKHIYTNQDSALFYLDEAHEIAKKSNYTNGLVKTHLEYGWYNMMLGNYEVAEENLKTCISLSKKNNNKKRLSDAYTYLAMVKSEQGIYEEALTHFLDAEKILKKIGKSGDIGVLENNIGILYIDLEEYDKAKSYYESALEKLISLNDYVDLSQSYQGLSGIALKIKDTTNAIKYASLYLETSQKTEIPSFIAGGYHTFGTYQEFCGNMDSAIVYWEKAQHIYYEINDLRSLALINLNIANVYLSNNKYIQALMLTNESLEISTEMAISKTIMEGYKLLVEIHLKLKNYKQAYKSLDQYIELREETLNENTKKAVIEVEKKYEIQLKDEQIKQLKNQDKINQLEINKKESKVREQKYLVIILILILIFLIIGFWLYRKSQLLRQEKIKLKLEQQVFRTQMNPHFIFNALNSIQRMYLEGNLDKASSFMSDFAELMRTILENSSHYTIPLKEEIKTLEYYLNLEKLRCQDKFTYSITIDPTIDLQITNVPPLIIQPFVENAIWHGILPKDGMGHISIAITKEKNRLKFEIHDNGVGIDSKKQSQHKSKGIHITEQRIGSKVIIESIENEKTSITFYLKIEL